MRVVRLFSVLIGIALIIASCETGEQRTSDEDPGRDKQIRRSNLEIEEDQSKNRFPCDTLALHQHIIDDFPDGVYLVEFDRTFTYNIPKPAVLYYKGNDNERYIFAVLAKSKAGERLIEPKNIVGFESSYINLDSTKLGTAFIYLTLFKCEDDDFTQLWEAEVPIHGGFNRMRVKHWKPQNIRYIELNFEAGIISGHRSYNYFFVDGIENPPHLMETYLGIVHKRTMANVNNDKFPDYYEYRFSEDSLGGLSIRDSIPFYWSEQRELYITDVNRRWYRKY